MLLKTIENIHLADQHKEKHLEKFIDIDNLFLSTQDIVREYFQTQSEFNDFEAFRSFLKQKISYYYVCFSNLESIWYDNYRCIEEIAQKYNKIIFFEEKNPYTEIREETNQAIEKIIK